MRIKYIIPFPFGPEGVAMRAAGIPRGALDSDTIVDCVAVRNSFDTSSPDAGANVYDAMLLEMYVVEAGLAAEDEGYDAVVIDTMSDSGLDVLRSRLTIPVLGQGTAAVSTAISIGRRLAFLVYVPENAFIVEKVIAYHGIGARCTVHALDLVPDFERLLDDDFETQLGRFEEVGRAAIAEARADTIVLGSGTMYQAAAPLQARLGVPVIDPASVTLRLAESLVRLGLSHSKVSYPSPPVIQDHKFRSLEGAS
ncbi:putative hydantoin racemase [Conexibacter woesei DSM 14684]|uniref:Putative hydantoin racemase n=1 Tax=Conexibacter woesei (strain DSM 14684 / CCUG 47730 / CIP 108061 / JCM 11494 / NBRC 100937 / ID131577) TaxID=469383 RepID=D3F485_CONWI|nr:putative hydantoin racemase [Conexibacter woesei DSM 14684]